MISLKVVDHGNWEWQTKTNTHFLQFQHIYCWGYIVHLGGVPPGYFLWMHCKLPWGIRNVHKHRIDRYYGKPSSTGKVLAHCNGRAVKVGTGLQLPTWQGSVHTGGSSYRYNMGSIARRSNICFLEQFVCSFINSVRISLIQTIKLLNFYEKYSGMKYILAVIWLSWPLSAEIFIGTGESGFQVPILAKKQPI